MNSAPVMARQRSSSAPVLRIQKPEGTARILRAHLFQHNIRILFLAFGTLLLAAVLWLLLYGVACWLILLTISARGVSDAEVPRTFVRWFAVLALLSVAWVWLCRRLMPDERARDKKRTSEVISEFVLAIPRVTLSVFNTLSALRRLSAEESEQAAVLIHRLSDEGRIPLSSVPQELPNPRSRDRVLLTLQLMQIIDLQKSSRDWFVTLHAMRPKAFQFSRSANDQLW
jgi:hypothetical protein